MSAAADPSFLSALASAAHALATRIGQILAAALNVFIQPGSQFSLWSLLCAFLVALSVLALRQRARGRPLRLRPILKILFPRRIFRSASTNADLGFFLLNNFATGAMIGWALISFEAVQHLAQGALTAAFGPPHPHTSLLTAEIIQTVAMFLAYEFAYWLNHYCAHEFPFLWEFHRVHHTAETLTPATVFRVHPIDSLVFYNMAVIIMGTVNVLVGYLTGVAGHGFTIGGSNLIALAAICLLGHLQHSHMWIAFTGRWGRILLSPAHHQIHHSTDPAHFGKNLGSSLAVFDVVFGTLHLPEKKRQKLVFGVEPGQHSPHTITGGLVTPFVRCIALFRTPVPAISPMNMHEAAAQSPASLP
jgi:sterol desaturase/sphingolipid hydroxylase (fatty acid hydroxylase superfamily)